MTFLFEWLFVRASQGLLKVYMFSVCPHVACVCLDKLGNNFCIRDCLTWAQLWRLCGVSRTMPNWQLDIDDCPFHILMAMWAAWKA